MEPFEWAVPSQNIRNRILNDFCRNAPGLTSPVDGFDQDGCAGKRDEGAVIPGCLASSLVLISGLSYKTTFNKELWTSSFPLYSIKPNLRNLFMKKLTRDRVVPIISASVS
jgi:hypothetical protein